MESCKQVSWGQFSEAEEIMTTSNCKLLEEESSISCSLNGNVQVEEGECSMCGDVGLPQYRFKCLRCSHRYQHIYCGKFYPYRIEATICNWCLPMDKLVKTSDIDDHADVKVCNSIHFTNRHMKSELETNSNCPIDQQKQSLEKHTKAFEYLLQIAELHDHGHQWDNLTHPFEEENCIIGTKLSKENFVGHYQNNAIFKFYEVGNTAKEPASLLMQQIIIRDQNDDHTRSFYGRRRGDKINSVRRPSINSAHDVQCSHSHGYTGYGQMGRNQDVGHSQMTKKSLNREQITKKLLNEDLGHNQTIKKLNYEEIDHRNDLQEPVKDHEIGCTDRDDQNPKRSQAAAVKLAQLHKLPEVAAGCNHCHINTADQQKMRNQAACSACSDNSDDRHAGKFSGLSWHGAGDNSGPSKRPRHGQSGVEQVIASENDEFNTETSQRGTLGNSDTGKTAADHDQQRVVSSKQGSPTSQQQAWSRPAGKRDHLIMNSPSRAMKCRYKLLADVLC